MKDHRMHVLAAAGLIALAVGSGLAQTTQPAGDPGPTLVDIPGVESRTGEGAGAAPPSAAPAGDANQPTTGPARTRPQNENDSPFGNYFIFIMLGGIVLLYVFMGRGRRKQEAKRKEMLSSLKKGDKVVTIGGIMGTIMDARPEEITVKVDETNNVRMKFARWAVRGVGEEAKKEGQDDKK